MDKNYIAKDAKVGKNTVLNAPVRLVGNANVKHSCNIGNYTFINAGTTLFPGTKMGKYCSIGKNCELGAFDHPTTWLSSSAVQYNLKLHFPDYVEDFKQKKIDRPKTTIFGNDVWVGSLAIVKRGLTIGDGAIIAGGSVVVKDVPPYAIVGGVPAKVLKYRFDEEIIQDLLELKWWDMDVKDLGDISFDNIELAVEELKAKKAAKESCSSECEQEEKELEEAMA